MRKHGWSWRHIAFLKARVAARCECLIGWSDDTLASQLYDGSLQLAVVSQSLNYFSPELGRRSLWRQLSALPMSVISKSLPPRGIAHQTLQKSTVQKRAWGRVGSCRGHRVHEAHLFMMPSVLTISSWQPACLGVPVIYSLSNWHFFLFYYCRKTPFLATAVSSIKVAARSSRLPLLRPESSCCPLL
jgi:hypothetical protein